MILSIVISLLYHPFMIRLLGQSEYGLYSTVASTISLLSVLNLGFNAGYIRYYSKYKKAGDYESIYKLNGLFLIIFAIIGAISLICGTVLAFNLNWVFDQGLTAQEYGTATILMLLLGVNMAISFPTSVFSTIISANERFVFLKLLGMVKTIISPMVTLPLLFLGYRSIAMVSVTLILSVLTDSVYFIYVKKALKNKFIFHGFEKGLFKSLFAYTGFIAINIIIDQINWNIDKLLLGRYKGTIEVAVYAVGFFLYQYYSLMSTAISGVFTPRVHNLITATKDDLPQQRKVITELFVKVGRVQFLILGLVASGIVFFGKPFIYYWSGNGYENSYYVALLLIIPASIALTQNVGLEIQRAQNKHKFRSFAYLIMAIVNLVLSIFLCQWYGAIGSAIGTAISLVLANGLIMNVYYHKACNLNVLIFWKNILKMSLGLIVPIACGVLIVKFINLYSLVVLFAFIFIYAIVYFVSMWFVGMNEYEKNIVRKVFKRLKR
ncbi:MAG: polysaccharide biosynthesis protein [Clostridia bacterium]|nr:polysaccharide biosynthesis protein [Clostridia bacterium]